jgi:hypothetical protein
VKWLGRGALFGSGVVMALLVFRADSLHVISGRLGRWAKLMDELDDERDTKVAKAIAREMKSDG